MSALVLLVEDEEPIQVLLSYNLEAEGYRVRHTALGEDVTRMIAEELPDIVVLDFSATGLPPCVKSRRVSLP